MQVRLWGFEMEPETPRFQLVFWRCQRRVGHLAPSLNTGGKKAPDQSTETDQDTREAGEGGPSPTLSSLKYLSITVANSHFLSYFTDVKNLHQTEDVNYST